jgi:hypothetical protein
MLLKSSNNRVGTSFEELIQTVLEVHLGKGAIERNPNGKNCEGYELAYGHHRLAAKQAGLKEADFIVKKLSDEMMLQIMVRENDDESRSKLSILFEGVKATVAALAEGKISVGEISKNTDTKLIRYAPSFVQGGTVGDSPKVPYTADSIGVFLGEVEDAGHASKVLRTVLNALELIERKVMSERDVQGLTVTELITRIPVAVRRHQEVLAIARRQAEATQRLQEEADRRKIAFDKEEAKNKAAISAKAAQLAQAEAEENDRKYKKYKEACGKRA